MQKKPDISSDEAELRRRAEILLSKQHKKTASYRTEADTTRLLHELQVHQIELEMQNVELQSARDQLEATLAKYTDLYDFAPVGYFSIDEEGLILEMNLTGAAMLGSERSRLLNRRFHNFMPPASGPSFSAFLKRVFGGPGNQVCEVLLLNQNGAAFWADIQALSAVLRQGTRKWCRVVVSNITALKRAEEAQRRMEDLSATNRKLQQEIARRQAMDAALKESEEHKNLLLVEARQLQQELRRLSHQVLQAQEEERKRISRDLHDQVAQALVGINVHLTDLAQHASLNSKMFKQRIARTQRLVEKSVDIVHQFARELRPPVLDDLGLVPALQSYIKEFTKRTGIRIGFKTFTSSRITGLDNAKSTVLYRVAQEALTNVAKHAQASQIKMTLQQRANTIELEVTDDGRGFVVERMFRKPQGRLGVLGMRERVQMIGGEYSLVSAPGQGTTVRAQIPLRSNTRAVRTRRAANS